MSGRYGTAYEVLGVTPEASQAQISEAYRRLVRVVHPDRGGDHLAFGEVQQAYEHIRTPQRRADYEQRLLDATTGTTAGGRLPSWVARLVDHWFLYGSLIVAGFAAIATAALLSAGPLAAAIVGAICLLALAIAAVVSWRVAQRRSHSIGSSA